MHLTPLLRLHQARWKNTGGQAPRNLLRAHCLTWILDYHARHSAAGFHSALFLNRWAAV
jgi:hypothetical protein